MKDWTKHHPHGQLTTVVIIRMIRILVYTPQPQDQRHLTFPWSWSTQDDHGHQNSHSLHTMASESMSTSFTTVVAHGPQL